MRTIRSPHVSTEHGHPTRPERLVWLAIAVVVLILTGCAGRGGQLADDDEVPPEIARIPDAVPKVEPLSRSGNASSYVVFGKRYYTKKSSRGHVERGLASWYGKPFHGRKTSSGEIYDMHAMTAAHKTLPLPTYARVTNIENGRSVVVKINDRGPFHGPRIVDLSYTAAVKLGVVKRGTAKVEVRAIDPRRSRSDTSPFLTAQTARPRQQGQTLYLQIGAFGDPSNAERLRQRLTSQLADNEIRILQPMPAGEKLYRVRIGPLSSAQDAERISRRIARLGVGMPHPVWN